MFESVARSASESAESPSPQNSTNEPTTPRLRSSSVSVEHEVGRGHAGAQRAARSARRPRRRRPRIERLAEHHRLGLDAADAEAEDAEPVDHRRVRVGADERVGDRERAPSSRSCDDRPRCSRLTWWTMPMPGGTTRKPSNAPCAQRSSCVALAVALVLAVDVAGVGELACRTRRPGRSGRSRGRTGTSGSTRAGVAAGAGHRGAHRREVDDRGHAREVLQHDARGLERHRGPRRARARVARERLDVRSLTCFPPPWRSRFSSRILTVWGSRESRRLRVRRGARGE